METKSENRFIFSVYVASALLFVNTNLRPARAAPTAVFDPNHIKPPYRFGETWCLHRGDHGVSRFADVLS